MFLNSESRSNSPKKILVLTADAGFGHRSAAKAISTALEETYADSCQVYMVNPLDDKRVPLFLRESQTDYDKIVNEMPRLYKFTYAVTDTTVISAVVDGGLIVMLFEAIQDTLNRVRPDVVVTTYPHYQAPLSAVYILSNRYIPLLSVVTDLSTVHGIWFHKSADMCLTPTEKVRSLAIKYGLDPRRVVITGIPVDPVLSKRQDRSVLRQKLGWSDTAYTVLAVGSKRVGNLRDTVHVLNHSYMPVQLVAVAGGDDELYTQFKQEDWHVPAHVYNFVTNLPEMMHAADCIICKAGGLIVSESLACGLPLLLVDALPGQETGNAEYVVENGAGELAGDPLKAQEILYHWLADDGALLAERKSQAVKIGRPRSAYEVSQLVWNAAQLGPQRRKEHNQTRQRKLTAMLDRHRIRWRHSR